jgi:hypothetical protein
MRSAIQCAALGWTGLVDLDLVSVVIGCRDRRGSGVFDALGQPPNPLKRSTATRA